MNLSAIAKTTLESAELKKVKLLFSETKFSAFTQNPQFSNVIGNNALHILIYQEDSFSLIGYSLVETKKKLLATISFGPLCTDENLFPLLSVSCISALQDYGIKIIRFQPPFIESSIWHKTVELLKEKFLSFSLPSELNWSTLILDISPLEEDLVKSFSENHRRSLKKAKNEGLVIEQVFDEKDIKGFAEGLCKMYAARKIGFNLEVERQRLKTLFVFTVEQGNGFILIVKKETQLIGGIVLIKHNNTILYLLGFSDPDYKNIPINHLLFLKSFNITRSSGCIYFDFGGYAQEDNANKQLLNINRFKDGFKGNRIDHEDTLLIAKNFLYKFLFKYYVRFLKK